MRLNDALITSERYRGEPSTDEDGKTTWPVCVLWDEEVPGLGVRIFPPVRGRPSRKDFIVTWKLGLKSRTMAIGTFGVDCTLRQARRTAREALDLARRGQDPIEARHRALGIGTNEDLASRFLFEHTTAAKRKPVPGGEPQPAETPGAEASDAAAPGPPQAPEAAALDTAATPVTAPTPEGAPEVAAAEAAGPGAQSADEAPAELEHKVEESETPSEAVPDAPSIFDAPAPAASPAAPSAPVVTAAAETPPASSAVPSLADLVADHAARKPESPPSALPKRGPTKVRLLPVPESLHREIERRARAGGLTISAYLQSLVDLEAAVTALQRGAGGAGHRPVPESSEDDATKDEMEQADARQTVDVAALMGDTFDPES